MAVGVGVGVKVAVAVAVAVAVEVGVGVEVGVAVAVAAGVCVGVKVGVGVDVGVEVAVGVEVGVALGDAVGVGVGVGAPKMFMHWENSEVSIGFPEPSSLVAVAVATVSPVGSGNGRGPKLIVQSAPVVTTLKPRKCCPSPNPLGSHDGLEKNSRRNIVLATLSKVPESVTLPPPNDADVITG